MHSNHLHKNPVIVLWLSSRWRHPPGGGPTLSTEEAEFSSSSGENLAAQKYPLEMVWSSRGETHFKLWLPNERKGKWSFWEAAGKNSKAGTESAGSLQCNHGDGATALRRFFRPSLSVKWLQSWKHRAGMPAWASTPDSQTLMAFFQ